MTDTEPREEIWRMIPRYPCKYEVSDRGRVRSLWITNGKAKILRAEPLVLNGGTMPRGYKVYTLRDWDRKVTVESVGRLILEAFVGPAPSSNHEAAHEDGIPSHNYLSNFTWKTAKANNADKYRHGTEQTGERCGGATLKEWQVLEIRDKYEPKKLGFHRLAEIYGVSKRTVHLIVMRKTWRHLPLTKIETHRAKLGETEEAAHHD